MTVNYFDVERIDFSESDRRKTSPGTKSDLFSSENGFSTVCVCWNLLRINTAKWRNISSSYFIFTLLATESTEKKGKQYKFHRGIFV